MDEVEVEHLWKERDDLLQTIDWFHGERYLARQEHANAQQQICLLEGELRGEKDLKVAVEAMAARLAMEVRQRWELI